MLITVNLKLSNYMNTLFNSDSNLRISNLNFKFKDTNISFIQDLEKNVLLSLLGKASALTGDYYKNGS